MRRQTKKQDELIACTDSTSFSLSILNVWKSCICTHVNIGVICDRFLYISLGSQYQSLVERYPESIQLSSGHISQTLVSLSCSSLHFAQRCTLHGNETCIFSW